MTTHEPVPLGPREIAVILGVNRQRVLQLMNAYADFPAPWVELGTGRIWRDTDVIAWATHKGRTARPAQIDVAPPWSPS